MRRVLEESREGRSPSLPLRPSQVRSVFLGAWAVAALLLAAALLVGPATPSRLGPPTFVAHVGSPVPYGTDFPLDNVLTIAMFTLSLTGPPPGHQHEVQVQGNWTSTAPTWVEVMVGAPAAAPCYLSLACSPDSGQQTGTFGMIVPMATGSLLYPEVRTVTLYLQFWALGSDTVTAATNWTALAVS